MATERTSKQSKSEIRTYYCDFSPDLASGVTVSSAVATHIPPSGSALTPTVVVSIPYVNVTLGQLTVTGTHILSIVATLSSGDKSEIRLSIQCDY